MDPSSVPSRDIASYKTKGIYLVTGSSGFIGQRMCHYLTKQGHYVFGIDIRDNPLRASDRHRHIKMNLALDDTVEKLQNFFKYVNFATVIHLAGLICVSEGEKKKELYWEYNVKATNNILDFIMLQSKRQGSSVKLIFASSAAVYDVSDIDNDIKAGKSLALLETSKLGPVSHYGANKLECEELIEKYSKDGLEAVIVRFFNVAGGQEIHFPSIHLIPIIVEKIDGDEPITIFGNQHSTPDGTCIRDFFHVTDLILAIEKIMINWNQIAEYALGASDDIEYKGNGFYRVYNLGSGKGHSVLEVCRKAIQISRQLLNEPTKAGERLGTLNFVDARQCDPPVLLADVSRAYTELNWTSKLSLADIIQDTVLEMSNI